MAISVDACVVALLGRDDGARRQLRQALEELGAAVAFEGEPASASDTGVLGVSPNVVIVNLEEGADDDLDHLQAVFDDPAINVVFNDADVSRALEGWDLARWARHLAAKVLGSEDTMPPPPEGAERLIVPDAFVPTPGPVPTPAQLAPETTLDSFLDEALGVVDEVPVDALPEATEVSIEVEDILVVAESDGVAEALDIDFSSLDGALEAADAPAPVRLASTPEPVESQSLDMLVVEDLSEDIARALDAGEADVPAVETLIENPAPLAEADVEFGWDFDEPAQAATSPAADPAADVLADAADAGDAVTFDAFEVSLDAAPDSLSVEDDFSWDAPDAPSGVGEASVSLNAGAWSVQDVADAQADEAALLDDDVAALAAQLDSLEASAPAVEAEAGLDFSGWDDSASGIEPQPRAEIAAPAIEELPSGPDPAASVPSFGGLSLTPMGDDAVSAVESTPVAAKTRFDFSGLEGLSLEPIESEAAPETASAGIVTLDLVEREPVAADPVATDAAPSEVVAAAADSGLEPDIDPLLVAMGLVEAPASAEPDAPALATAPAAADAGGIGHVVVLGASIGGPDALRTFLGELPASVPAVFLLVQHLESGYFERLAQQLQKSSPLPVRVATADAVAAPGEVLVIPASERVTLEADGRLVFSPHATVPHYTPCIDDVLRDVADRFGNRATAIIFSGMAGDAVEGAVYLTARGGEVWTQDPSSCVVSSMVDGARARGVVEFTGSPRELAQRCVTQFVR